VRHWGLTAELVQQGRVGLAEEGALDHHIAEPLDLRRLVPVTRKPPVRSLERVGKLIDVVRWARWGARLYWALTGAAGSMRPSA
jgi:hypothetical protein